MHGINPARFEFHDPDWGTGDLMQMKATKLVYEHVKRIKPHAMVRRQSPGDSYMQPYYDMANMCEEWNGHTRAWYRRAHIGTRVLQDCILHLDAWFVTLTKLTEYYFAMAAIWAPCPASRGVTPTAVSCTTPTDPESPTWTPSASPPGRRWTCPATSATA